MSRMLKSSGAMGAATLASRLLGLAREMVYARFMGNTAVAGAFIFAFMIPNLFRRLLGEGALTAAFIPAFKEKERRQGENAMWEAANAVISGLILVASAVSGLVLIGLTAALHWGSFPHDTELMLKLLRIMFPYMLLVCLAAVFMGMLNARGFFFAPSLGAGLLNLVMIAAVLVVAPAIGESLDQQIYALAYAVLVAGIVQAGFQLPILYRNGYRLRWVAPWHHPTVHYILKQMIPGTIGVAAFQINLLLTQGIAFWVGASVVASFNYAVRLMEFPQGIFGVSLATFILPTLSGFAAEKKFPQFRQTLAQGLSYLWLANSFAAAIMLVLAPSIVRLLFEYGAFDSDAVARTADALACLAPALLGYATVNMLVRAFHALGDISTPMKISVVSLAFNLLLTLWLIHPLREAGLGLANSLSSLVNVGLLLHALKLKLKHLDLQPVVRSVLRMLAAALLSGIVAWAAHQAWSPERIGLSEASLLFRVGAVFLPLLVAAPVYLLVCWRLDVESVSELFAGIRSFLRRGSRRTPKSQSDAT